MKKYLLAIFAAIMVSGFAVSCTEDTAEDDQLYEQASDKDEEPDK